MTKKKKKKLKTEYDHKIYIPTQVFPFEDTIASMGADQIYAVEDSSLCIGSKSSLK